MNYSDDTQVLIVSDAYRVSIKSIAEAVETLNMFAGDMRRVAVDIKRVRDTSGDTWRLNTWELLGPHMKAICSLTEDLVMQHASEHSRMIDKSVRAQPWFTTHVQDIVDSSPTLDKGDQ